MSNPNNPPNGNPHSASELKTESRTDHPIVQLLRETPVPIFQLLGMKPVFTGAGHAVIEVEAGPQHANPMGTLHGGVLCDLADAAMGTAFAGTLEHEQSFTSLELKINFLRPVWNATLRAEAKVVAKGKSIGLVECEIRDERHKLVARATSTCMILKGEQAKGR
jgi:uncharacterized protein (TIGR00369 family)